MHVDSLVDGKEVVLDLHIMSLRPKKDVVIREGEQSADNLRTVQIVFKRNDDSPEETLRKSKKLLRQMRGLDEPVRLTVGDLSVTEKEKQKSRARDAKRYLRNVEQGLSIGDLSVVTEEKDSVKSEAQRARADRDGLTVGDLFVGRGFVPEPQTSESQELLAEMQAKHNRKREETLKLKQIMFEQEQEKKAWKEAAEARRRRDAEQVDQDVAKLLKKRRA